MRSKLENKADEDLSKMFVEELSSKTAEELSKQITGLTSDNQ